MTSKILTYYKEINTLGLLDGTYTQTPSLKLDNSKKYALRVLSCRLSPIIPNIFSNTSNDTTMLDISNDNFATRTTVVMAGGSYNVPQINLAIQNIIQNLNWNTDNNDSAFWLAVNPVSSLCYVRLDSTKLALGTQICVDFTSQSTSTLNELLGFIAPVSFNIDGLHDASTIPIVDYQGSNINIRTSFTNTSYLNGTPSNILCSFPASVTGNEIVYPGINTGLISPILNCDIPYIINGFDIKIENQRNNKSIYFGYGSITLQIEVIEFK